MRFASEDEAVTFAELTRPSAIDGVLLVVDATNLARNLYLAMQIRELGLPMLLALNMVDLAREAGRFFPEDDDGRTFGHRPSIGAGGEPAVKPALRGRARRT